MDEFEYTPKEDARHDYLMDVLYKDANEARKIILFERQQILGTQATTEVISAPDYYSKRRRRDHRGGRAYPEVSDSEADPFWNDTSPVEPRQPDPAADAAFAQFKYEAKQDTVQWMVEHEGMSEVEARARVKAKQEKRGRKS